MWGVDFYHLNPEKLMAGDEGGYIPTGAFEEILIDGLINFLQVAKEHLQLPLPVQIIGGLEGVVDYRLAVDPNYFAGHQRHVGHIFDNTIGCHAEIDRYDVDPYEVLLPLFERVYDAAGEERPAMYEQWESDNGSPPLAALASPPLHHLQQPVQVPVGDAEGVEMMHGILQIRPIGAG